MKPLRKDWPCNGCTDRFPACHGSCGRYLEAKAQQEAGLAERKAAYMLSGYTVDQIKKTKKKPGGLIKKYRPKGEE